MEKSRKEGKKSTVTNVSRGNGNIVLESAFVTVITRLQVVEVRRGNLCSSALLQLLVAWPWPRSFVNHPKTSAGSRKNVFHFYLATTDRPDAEARQTCPLQLNE